MEWHEKGIRDWGLSKIMLCTEPLIHTYIYIYIDSPFRTLGTAVAVRAMMGTWCVCACVCMLVCVYV